MSVSTLQPVVALRCQRNLTLAQPEPENVVCEAVSCPLWRGRIEALPGARHLCAAVTQKELQELSWQQFFSDPTQWMDCRRIKGSPTHPDFRHRKSKVSLWLNNWHKPGWVDIQLARWDAGLGTVFSSVPMISASTGSWVDDLELEDCSKLCEDGQIKEAVDALNLLVERGHYIPHNLFHSVLKRCTAQRQLALGRRVHALAVESGFEGHAFLATHLICLYASHWRLEEAMQVFSKVTTPSAYNWAAIISAYARNGEPGQAIGLYGRMRESCVKPDSRVFVAVLNACVSARNLAAGKDVHAHILVSTANADLFVQNSLVSMYAKCDSLEDARRVFDRLPQKDVVTWNTMIGSYAHQGLGEEALRLYSSMQHDSTIYPSSVTFVGLLQACACIGVAALHQGKDIHVQIERLGVQSDVVVGASVVNMYAKCGSLKDAQSLFNKLLRKDVVTWNVMISGYAQQGLAEDAFRLYNCMQAEDITSPDSVTFSCLLQACARLGTSGLCQGRQLHAHIEERAMSDDVVLGNCLVNMYAECSSLDDARRVFHSLPYRDVSTWNAMIAGYVQQGMGNEALRLYSSMQQEGATSPDSITFVCLLQACASLAALPLGKQLHARIIDSMLEADVLVSASLVNMYAKCGRLEEAHRLFENLSQKSLVMWTSLIAGYSQQGRGHEALNLFSSMQREHISPLDYVTFVCLLHACASVGAPALHQGKQLHAQIEEQGLQGGIVLGNNLVNMYAKCGSLEAARSVFDGLSEKDVVTWTAMIAGYTEEGMCQEALSLYSYMQKEGITPPNSVTFVCLLQACACLGALHHGKQIHEQIEQQGLQADLVVGTSLINMYVKCGCLEHARRIFERLPQKDVVTWTAMICGYAQEAMGHESLGLYSNMQREGITRPNSVTYVCLLQACASVAALPLGKQIHAQIKVQGLENDPIVGPGLLHMYAKCGSLEDAERVFNSLPERGIVAWNALIAGYSHRGEHEAVFDLVERMRKNEINPDGITLLSVLTVCSHVGLVDVGRRYFETMIANFGINATIEHYSCMMDLLCRAGHLDEGLRILKTMPFQPNVSIWLTLLSACRKWGNVEVGRQAFESVVRLEETIAAAYVLMSNIYAGAEMWQDAKQMQARRVKCGAWKVAGRSWWVDMDGAVYSFAVEDAIYPPIASSHHLRRALYSRPSYHIHDANDA